MDKKELFQKYIDSEISDEERLAVEQLLQTDPEAAIMYESLSSDRMEVLNTMEQLNPDHIPLPLQNFQIKQTKRNLWRIAALILLLIGISAILWVSREDPEKIGGTENIAEIIDEEIIKNNLDYYISPNRCWNNRELVWTINKIK